MMSPFLPEKLTTFLVIILQTTGISPTLAAFPGDRLLSAFPDDRFSSILVN